MCATRLPRSSHVAPKQSVRRFPTLRFHAFAARILCLLLTIRYSPLTLPALAQGTITPNSIITTVAGGSWVFRCDGCPATSAPLGKTVGVVVDSVGDVFATDADNSIVVKISTAGVLTVVAGNGLTGFSGDGGPATSASLWQPEGLAMDAAGNPLYFGKPPCPQGQPPAPMRSWPK